MRKEITFYIFLGENIDPSEIYANPNLRNLTHITQKPSYVYTFFTYTLKEITASAQISRKKSPFFSMWRNGQLSRNLQLIGLRIRLDFLMFNK